MSDLEFDCPGGKLEKGETTDAGARREFLEEAGISIEDVVLLHLYSRDYEKDDKIIRTEVFGCHLGNFFPKVTLEANNFVGYGWFEARQEYDQVMKTLRSYPSDGED